MILVTGATGLVGSHLVLQLIKQGQDVKAMYRNEKSKNKTKQVFDYYKKANLFDKINWIQGDILDVPGLEDVFSNIEYVYHCAALISFDPKDESKLRKINIEGTANVVNFCIDYKVKKLCFISSIAALGDLNENESVVTEETEWNSEKEHNYYAISKYGAEIEVWRGQQEGLNVVILNPGVILGPFFWKEGSGEIYQNVKKGLQFYTQGTTGFVSVSDVVAASTKIMQSDTKNERFVLVSENITYQNLVNSIAKILFVGQPKIKATKFLTGLAWRIDWLLSNVFGKKRILTRDLSNSLHSENLYSNEKVTRSVGFQFQKIDDYLREI